MAECIKPDLCIIGAGAGGLAIAASAAPLGAEVVLVERIQFHKQILHASGFKLEYTFCAAGSEDIPEYLLVFDVN